MAEPSSYLDQYNLNTGHDPTLDAVPHGEPVFDEKLKRWRDPVTNLFVAAPKQTPSPAAPEAPTTPPPPKHAEGLAKMAQRAGFSQTFIDSVPSDQLAGLVHQAFDDQQRHYEDLSRRYAASKPSESTPAVPPVASAPLPPPSSTEGEFNIDRSKYDPATVGFIDDVEKYIAARLARIEASYEKRFKPLEDGVAYIGQREQARQHETIVQHFDRRFAERPELFGVGPGNKLKPESPEFMKRDILFRAVAQAAQKDGDLDGHYDRLVSSLFGAGVASPAASAPTPPTPVQPRITQEQWAEATVAKPTQRQGAPEPKGTERAVKAVHELLTQNGSYTKPDDKSGFLPG